MRSQFVVVDDVGRKDSAQMAFADDDSVIKAFPADRADVSPHSGFARVSPRRRVISNAHHWKPLRDRVTA